MAEVGRRDVIGDPLALNPNAQPADRSVATMMVRNPGATGGKLDFSVAESLNNFGNAVAGVMKEKEDEYISQGKLQYMQGATEAEIAKTGNKWTMQGWQSLNAADKANRWYADEMNALSNGGAQMSGEDYNKGLMDRRAQALNDLPEDPAVRKLYVAAFDDLAPRLTQAHSVANNEYNKKMTTDSFTSFLDSGSYTNGDQPQVVANSPLMLSSGKVRPTLDTYTPEDVDLLARVMLGEAGGEGATGMAAVAHNVLNRAIDGGFGGRSIKGVVMKQGAYSSMNAKTGYIGGEGANSLVDTDKNSSAYQKAVQIAQQVLSGHHVDPTNGASHFVVKGLQPNWRASVEAQGGVTQIGNHEYMGKARNLGTAASSSSGNLKFVHKDQTNLDVGFANALSSTGLALGRDLTIQSGHRDASHPVEAAKSKPGMHSTGKAADIDMSGMDDEERKNLVRTLRQQGIVRFGTYDKHTNMLHVDMSKEQGESWFMHNKTNKQIGKAPKWFQEVANEPVAQGGTNIAANNQTNPEGVLDASPVPTDTKVSVAQTQMQDAIRSYNMPRTEKATAVSQKLITQLEAGSSALWDGIGGTAFLQELGATPQEIRQVQNAHERFQREQSNKFNMDRAQWQASLTADITTGKKTLAEAEAEIQKRYDGKELTDANAYGLINAVTQASIAQDRAPNMDPTLQRALANTYAAIRNDPKTYSPEWADGHIRWLAEKYGMPPAQLQQRLAEAWQTEETSKNAALTAARTAHTKAETRAAKIAEVDTALKVGSGLSNITGSVDDMPAQQFGVKRRWDELKNAAAEAIPGYMQGGMTQLEAQRKAAAVAENQLWKEMQAQGGVVYDELAASVTAGASGVVISAGGKVNDDAKEALDTWMRLKEVDPSGAYASKYATTEQSRNLLMLAEKYYTGGFDLDTALRKAGEFMSTGLTEPADITKSTNFNRKLQTSMRDNFDTLMGSPGWFGESKVRMGDKQHVLTTDSANNQLKQAIQNKAWAYFAAEPQMDPDVIMKKAAQDVIKDSAIIGGNVMVGRNAGGTPIKDQMGLSGYSADTPSEATDMWVQKFAEDQIADVEAGLPDTTGWAKQYKDKRGGRGIFANNNGGGVFRDRNPVPPYHASWDQDSGTLAITLWKDGDRKETVSQAEARTLYVPVEEIGRYYKEKTAPSEPNFVQKAWTGLWGMINAE